MAHLGHWARRVMFGVSGRAWWAEDMRVIRVNIIAVWVLRKPNV